ncbi:MAG: glycosyl transferase [Pseudanabaena frigida]|uniref:Glycosyl transferase n=1 Tax=Pseudanabaena frigida TaxID=945775 RepID=A0A2W4XTB4_9CYAN|nr:MAG: glycosyl transferase [Pseudanabaena frigida]
MKSQIIRNLSKKLKLGVIAYKLYYAPKSFIQKLAHRSVFDMYADFQGQLQMEKSTYNLTTKFDVTQKDINALNIHFLTGRKFWYQTCFCAYSMSQQTNNILRPVIYDDGSLKKQHQEEIVRIFPNAKIILNSAIEEYIDRYLPQNKFPYLRERRLNYPHIRKITDIHIGSQGWKLVLDSDMLFFRTPHVLMDWLNNPSQPCHMVDVQTAYGYSLDLMTTLANSVIPERVNVGICGLKSEDIDWEKLEYWCKTMIEQQGTSYYQEQALVAMLIAGKSCVIVPAKEYIVMPSCAEVIQPKAVLHHYVADSKSWYFRYGWKHIVQHNCKSLF